jgi:hypothetical protein
MSGYFSYYHFGLSSYADNLLIRVRKRVCRTFLKAFSPSAKDTVLDIGISENNHISANYLEKTYPHPKSIVALGTQPYPSLKTAFPAVTLVCGDGRALPFADESFDYVYSHAVIEHTGSRASQQRFIAEAFRVCRKGVLLTTPNRWHPVETHIGLPFIHYLPASVFRRLCRALGKTMYAQEETLNLLSSRQLAALVRVNQIEFHNIRWLGIVSNLVLVIRKPRPHSMQSRPFSSIGPLNFV